MYQEDIKRIFKHLLLKYETQVALNKKSDRKLERLSIIELSILEYVHDNEEVVLSDLINSIDMKRSKVIGIIKKLTETKHLDRRVNPDDKRSSYVVLGKVGKALLNSYLKHETEFLDFVLKDMSINEEKVIVKFLSKINQTEYMK